MVALDPARGRATRTSQVAPIGTIDATRRPRRSQIAVEMGEVIVALVSIALAVLALRFVLVLAHGVLH